MINILDNKLKNKNVSHVYEKYILQTPRSKMSALARFLHADCAILLPSTYYA